MARLPKICILLACLVMLSASAQAVQLVDRVVAVVNGKLITLFDLNSKVAELVQRTQGVTFKPDDPQYADLQRQVLDSMINDILIEKEAERLHVTASETELDTQINEIKKKNNFTEQQLKAELLKEGLTMQQFREQLRKSSLKKQILGYMVNRRVHVTDEEVRDFYEHNKNNLPTQHSLSGPKVLGSICLIMLPTMKDAESLRAKIASGSVTFADAAKRFSIGPGRDDGGNLGDVQLKDLAPPLRAALTAVPAGQVSNPVMLDGKAVLLMQRTGKETAPAPAKPEPAASATAAPGDPGFDAVKDQIKELLFKQKFEKVFQEFIDKLRSKAVVEVKL